MTMKAGPTVTTHLPPIIVTILNGSKVMELGMVQILSWDEHRMTSILKELLILIAIYENERGDVCQVHTILFLD